MIEIIPSSPTQNDTVILKVTGQGCVIDKKLIDNNPVFTGEVVKSSGCFATHPAYTFSFPLGKLQTGNYTARHFIRIVDLNSQPTVNGPPTLVTHQETTTFKVTASQARNIPTLDTASIILLTMVLALTVGKFIRKQST